jgi:hypothetical protein
VDVAIAEDTVRRCISGVLDALVARETDRPSTYRLAAEFASSIPVSFQGSVGQVCGVFVPTIYTPPVLSV